MPITKSPWPGSRLRPVNLDPAHYRSGRWFLLAEGLPLVALSLGALIAGWAGAAGGPDGVRVLMLSLTPTHSWVLLGFGVAAVLATMHRKATIAVAVVGAVGFLLLFAIGAAAAARPGVGAWGLDMRDAALHVGLLVYNLVLLFWVASTAMQGRVWMRRAPLDEAGNDESDNDESDNDESGNAAPQPKADQP
ncbi:MAG: hypothetical protein ACR2G2_13530 [Pseudonocardia sp.]